MKIFGKTVSEYAGFEKWFLILVLLVGLSRLILSLAGVTNSVDKFLSLTVLMLLGVLYFAVRVATSGFGGYKQLLPVYALGWIVAEGIVITGIVISIVSAKDNIFQRAGVFTHESSRTGLGVTRSATCWPLWFCRSHRG